MLYLTEGTPAAAMGQKHSTSNQPKKRRPEAMSTDELKAEVATRRWPVSIKYENELDRRAGTYFSRLDGPRAEENDERQRATDLVEQERRLDKKERQYFEQGRKLDEEREELEAMKRIQAERTKR